MELGTNLKLVVHVSDTVKVVHQPIDRMAFEMNYKVIAMAFRNLVPFGAGGERIAALVLRDLKDENGDLLNTKPFLEELKRLTSVYAQNDTEIKRDIPLSTALKNNLISDEDWREVESQLVFFTCHFSMFPKRARLETWNRLLTPESELSLLFMEPSVSSETSTTEETLAPAKAWSRIT